MNKASRRKERPRGSVLPSETMPPFPSSLWAQPWTVLLLLSLLATLIYSNTFSASFHFDDNTNIVENPRIKNLSNLLDVSGSRYVGFLSFALNYHFGRLNVFGYHLVNLLIHITNSFLVYTLVLMLFKTPRMQSPPFNPNRSFGIALSTALLFVAHPIQTEAVTYIVQRFASLATLFYLLAVVLYLKWRLVPSEARSRSLWYAGAWLSTVLAMKTKEITFTLPFMLLLAEAIFFGSFTRKQWMVLIPFLLTLPMIPLSLPGAIGEGEAFARDTTAISRLDYLFTQFRVVLTYLRLLVLPVHQNLDYDYPIYHSLFQPPAFFSFLLLLALFGFSLYLLFLRPRASQPSRFTMMASRLAAFGILWFFLTLSIESSIIPIRDVIFEHRLYLPSVGFLLAGSVAILGLLDRWRGMKVIAIGVLVAIFSVATYQRNLIWNDDLTLWSDVIQKSPNKARGHNNLAVAYLDQKRWEEAILHSRTALSLDPKYAEAHNNLGNVYENLGRLDDSIREYKMALGLNPEDARIHNNLGDLYEDLGRLDDSIREYKTALTLKPDYAQAHYNLGLVYLEQGKLSEALVAFEEAVQLKPDYAKAHNNLGVIYQKLGRLEEAIREYEAAIALDPNHAEAHNNLGIVYKKKLGSTDKAIREYKTALTLKPDYAEAHYNLGNVYKDLGRLEEAVQEFQIALKLKPDLVEARYTLGQAYQHMGRIQEAIHSFEQALEIKPDYDLARQALKSLRQ